MSKPSRTLPTTFFLATITLLPAIASADASDFAGSWRFHALETPTRLQETFFNVETGAIRNGTNANDFAQAGEIVVNVFFPDPFSVDSGAFTIDAEGEITGDVEATLVQATKSRVTIRDDEGSFTLNANISGDILMRSEVDGESQGIALALKSPDSLNLADIAGNWRLVSFITPDDITINQIEGRVVDTFFVGGFDSGEASIQIAPNGSITGDITGTATVTGPATISVNVGSNSFPFSINESKNTLVSTVAINNEVEKIILVKEANTIAQADLQGTWRIAALDVPNKFIETYFNETTNTTRQADISNSAGPGEIWVDIFHPGRFNLTRITINVDENGNFSDFGGGSLVPHNGNKVSATLGGETFTFSCNDNQTLFTGIIENNNDVTLVVAIRTRASVPATFDEAVELLLTPTEPNEPLVISWNGASNVKLQAFDPEESEWLIIDLPEGEDSLDIDPAEFGPNRLFRIIELPLEEED